jgi:ribonuclease J
MTNEKLRVIPLGGTSDIGRNMALIEYGEDMIIVDVGLMFPEEEMLGVDLVLPNFTYVRENAHRLRGIFLTHGHEDHIGGVPYLLRDVMAPIYGARLTLELLEVKLREERMLNECVLEVVRPGDVVPAGVFEVEFFQVAHSIPDSCGLIISTPLGTIVHTGDFKIDHTPVMDQHTDLTRLGEVGAEGCLLLMADSTYADQEGYTQSEQLVGVALASVIQKAPGRVIIATFASQISRVQQIVEGASAAGRKVFVTGRSMVNNVAMAREIGYVQAPEGLFVGVDEMRRLADDELVIITTGSQGEPTSGLTRMANGEHRHITIKKGDTVVLSATPIPGNETAVARNLDNLFRGGADVVYYNRMANVHVRGHASREELKIIHSIVQPEYFVPIQGEYRHLVAHARLAETMGIAEGNAFVLTDGDVLEIDEDSAAVVDRVPAGYVYVDGARIGDIDHQTMRDRQHLSTDGFVVVIVPVDRETSEVAGEIEVLSRGFIDPEISGDLLEECKQVVAEALGGQVAHLADITAVNTRVRDATARFLYDKTRRRPMVLPVTVEV